ncbi:hypothetical protein F5Y05DRAFT_411814 [Hypoxylon sp. FL0543]|nr:hypothetical protein F5Y05DRAFT_411814 [Hypoxylon sp. FL0543]
MLPTRSGVADWLELAQPPTQWYPLQSPSLLEGCTGQSLHPSKPPDWKPKRTSPLSNPHYSHLAWDDTHAVRRKDGAWTITLEYSPSFHQASRGGHSTISSWSQPPQHACSAQDSSTPATTRQFRESPPSTLHNSYDWESSALGPADLFSSFGGPILPPTGDWSLGLGDGNINEVAWSLPGLDGVGDPFVLENNMSSGHLDASEMLPGYQANPDLLFNQPLGPHTMPEPEAGPANQAYSPSEMSPSSSSQGKAPRTQRRSPSVDPVTALKRQRNNVAARKYRQKRIDRITELEEELRGVKQERDDLRIRLARQEAEAAALRSMLQMNYEKGAKS